MRNFLRLSLLASIIVPALALLALPVFVSAQTAAPAQQAIALPAPQTTGGMPLMQALANRKTTRSFADKALSMQQLSNLLWAGFGVNRPSMMEIGIPPRPNNAPGPQPKPGRTAPSARNDQEINLYVVLAQGAYLYDAVNNQLKPVISSDLRTKIGVGAAAHAAATIVFVGPTQRNEYAQVDTGFIGQNIYLFAASEGLNAWFYALHNQDVAGALGLGSDKAVLYGESIGFPEK